MVSIDALRELLANRRVVVLTGAGCSTESGIPDYRSPESAARAKTPMQVKEFLGSPAARARYWARSFAGWRRFSAAKPNAAHRALAALEARGAIGGIITQNVDRLHHHAGSRRVVELHGALAEVRCLECGVLEDRESVQARLAELNPEFAEVSTGLAPDGDVELESARVERFRIAACRSCAGTLKPNVVFFGENVPPAITRAAWSLFDEAEALLVIGSSLAVFSGYRFVRRAAERALPIAIVNRGPTRGDPFARLKIDASAGEVLASIV